jgi:hypothetical protein
MGTYPAFIAELALDERIALLATVEPRVSYPERRQHVRFAVNERICPFDRQPRANFETSCRSPCIWKLSLVKAVDQRHNAILEVTTFGETCAVALGQSLTAQAPDLCDMNSESFSS